MSMRLSRRTRTRAVFFAASTALVTTCALTLPTASAEEPAPRAGQSTTDRQLRRRPDDPRALQEVWRTDFDGAAGSRPSADDWIIDTGTGYPGGPANWGTGERQTYTDRPENLQLDGDGHLKITALKDGGELDLGPHRVPAHRLRGPGRRQAPYRGEHPDARRLR